MTTRQWIETWRNEPITANERRQPGTEEYLAEGKMAYRYFSPRRPLSFVCNSVKCVLVSSDKYGQDFMYTAEPLPTDRIEAWELIPANDAAWAELPPEEDDYS